MNEIVDSLERNGLLIWLGRMDAIFVAEQYKKKRGVAWPTVLRMMGIRVDGKKGEGKWDKGALKPGRERRESEEKYLLGYEMHRKE